MFASDLDTFKVPGRSRRSLNSVLNAVYDKSIPCGKKLRKKLNICGPAVESHTSGSKAEHVSTLRVTRSSLKEWQQTYDCSRQNGTNKEETDVMKPPPQPRTKCFSSGMITRHRVRSLLRESSDTDLYHHLKDLCLRSGSHVSVDCASNTSEYGTASEDSKNCSVNTEFSPQLSSDDSCHCDSVSGVESLSDDFSGDDRVDSAGEPVVMDLSDAGWDSDCSESDRCSIVQTKEWDSDAEKDYFRHLRQSMDVTLIQAEQVMAIIPNVNCSNYQGDFKIHLKAGEDEKLYRQGLCCGMRVHHVSPVISVEPHGIQFFESFPALLVIPLAVEPQDDTWLSCLCSNTSEGQPPHWEQLPKKDYTYRNGRLVITAGHFSLFTVILEEPYPEVMKRIRCRTGGRLRLNEVPGVEVEFPRGCLEQDLDAYVRVLYDTEPSVMMQDRLFHRRRALASPVIMLGPHGHQFGAGQQPVTVKLPVPDYHEIVHRFGSQARLDVWQSSTREGEPMVWRRMDVRLTLPSAANSCTIPIVTFPVHHFSFFKVVWDILAASLYEAKMGMSYFYPYISFSMMCQAFMEESAGDNRFGLEVICYRSDKRLPETTNYRHRVGASLKPKLVRPGRILVRLRSQMFDADVEAGEDKEMAKEEPDFRGRDFEKQYACRFKPDINIERGTFGKVIVERIITGSKDPLFEFNLHKTGFEKEVTAPVGCERWTVFAMKELASSLQITEGNNWRKFAQNIGFTKSEIKSKLQYSPDPFLAMMNLYNGRGGTPQEFIQALYAVSRDLRLSSAGFSGSNSEGSSSRSGDSQGSGSHASSSQGSGGKGRRSFWGYRPWGRVNNDSDSESHNKADNKGKKRSHPSSKKISSNTAKRRKFSDVSETISSSSSDAGDESDKEAPKGENTLSTERHKNNKRKLNDKDLWQISAKIVRKDWRNLGRSLGIEEQALVNLEHSYQSIGFRECAYQMLMEWKSRKPRKCTFGELYRALQRENMAAVAKHMVKKINTEEGRDRESS